MQWIAFVKSGCRFLEFQVKNAKFPSRKEEKLTAFSEAIMQTFSQQMNPNLIFKMADFATRLLSKSTLFAVDSLGLFELAILLICFRDLTSKFTILPS